MSDPVVVVTSPDSAPVPEPTPPAEPVVVVTPPPPDPVIIPPAEPVEYHCTHCAEHAAAIARLDERVAAIAEEPEPIPEPIPIPVPDEPPAPDHPWFR